MFQWRCEDLMEEYGVLKYGGIDFHIEIGVGKRIRAFQNVEQKRGCQEIRKDDEPG